MYVEDNTNIAKRNTQCNYLAIFLSLNIYIILHLTDYHRLKALRKHLRLTQAEFSERLGIAQGSYSDVERGKKGISYNLLKNIISTFDINPGYIISGGDMKSNDSANDPATITPYDKSKNQNSSSNKSAVDRNKKSSKDVKNAEAHIDSVPETFTTTSEEYPMSLQYELQAKEALINSLETQVEALRDQIKILNDLLKIRQMEAMTNVGESQSKEFRKKA